MRSTLARAVGGIVVLAVLLEGGLRLAGLGYGNAPLDSDPVLHHVHPPGYRFTIYDPGGEFGGHVVAYGADGAVVDPEPVPAGTAQLRVALLGDGYVEATQVPYRQSLAGLLQRNLGSGWEVRNFGTSSYSPVLSRLQWAQTVRSFRPTHVLLVINEGDIADDRRYAAQARRDSAGRIIAVSGTGNPPLAGWYRRSYALRLLRRLWLVWSASLRRTESTPAAGAPPGISELTDRSVADLAAEVTASGAKFALIVIPSTGRAAQTFSDLWKSWAALHGIRFVDLVPVFHAAMEAGKGPFYVRNAHMSPEGHRLVAQAVGRALADWWGR